MSYFGQKPDYNRKKIKEFLYKLKLRLGEEYDEIGFNYINDWCSIVSVKTRDIGQKIMIDIQCNYESNGTCEPSKDVIVLVPFYEREENDKEYNERIEKEEKEYNEYLEIKKKEREQNAEYLKDLEEYKRIKQKYHF